MNDYSCLKLKVENIRKGTKKAEALIWAYQRANPNHKELSDVYGRHSEAKAIAMARCRYWCEQLDGTGFRITSHNSQFFSVAFECDIARTHYLIYITPMHNYITEYEA